MIEIRYLDNSEFRIVADDKGKPKIVGYAAVFNSLSEDLGGFREQIAPGAFATALGAGADVIACMHHDPRLPLGRSSEGTLKILEDNRGLYVEIDPPDTSVGRDAITNVQRRDIKGMSFKFSKAKDAWARNGTELVRTLLNIGRLHDVTLTTTPAYEATSASIRSADAEEAAAYIKARIAELEATPNRDAVGKRLGY